MVSDNGGIDLSGMVAAMLLPHMVSGDDSPALYTAVFVCIVVAMGAVGGLLNGVVIAKLRLTPILCTLGMQLLFMGIAVVLSNGVSVRVEYVDPLSNIGNGTFLQVPISLWIFVAAVLLLGWILKRTPFGLRLYLMGTNPKAAFYAGIPRARMLILWVVRRARIACWSHQHYAYIEAKWDYGNSSHCDPDRGDGRRESGRRIRTHRLRVPGCDGPAVSVELCSIYWAVSQFFGDCAWGFLLLLSLAFTGDERVRAIFSIGCASPRKQVPPPPSSTGR